VGLGICKWEKSGCEDEGSGCELKISAPSATLSAASGDVKKEALVRRDIFNMITLRMR
jgi:hypothetical protein